jgi:two-component system response regulator YcbB
MWGIVMKFFIVDDDDSVRMMLKDIIVDYDLGTVVGEVQSGCDIENELYILNQIDVLLLDLLMPNSCGLEIISKINEMNFQGTIIMISQVESKDMISKAYSLGVEYYILKPLNTIEVQSIIHKVKEKITLKKTLNSIQQSISSLTQMGNPLISFQGPKQICLDTLIITLFHQLGLAGTTGASDLMGIIKMLHAKDISGSYTRPFPKLKDIFSEYILSETRQNTDDVQEFRNIKASEQRIRRSINSSLIHLASIGSADYTNDVFESYAPKFFSIHEVRKVMRDLENGELKTSYAINTKKFLQMLCIELKSML